MLIAQHRFDCLHYRIEALTWLGFYLCWPMSITIISSTWFPRDGDKLPTCLVDSDKLIQNNLTMPPTQTSTTRCRSDNAESKWFQFYARFHKSLHRSSIHVSPYRLREKQFHDTKQLSLTMAVPALSFNLFFNCWSELWHRMHLRQWKKKPQDLCSFS